MMLNIIHLPHRKDRLKVLKNELLIQGINEYRLWTGIIDSESACRGISQAHKQIIRFAKQEHLKEILIAEDDIHFTSPKAFQFYIENKPSDYDIYLGGIIWGKLKEDNTVNDFSGTTLYMVNETFYDTLLAAPENKDFDRALANKGMYLVCNPMVAVQHDGFSDNQKRYIDFGPYIRRTALYGINK